MKPQTTPDGAIGTVTVVPTTGPQDEATDALIERLREQLTGSQIAVSGIAAVYYDFSRTLLPAAAESGLPVTTVSRHMPVLRRHLADAGPVLVAAGAIFADRPWLGDVVVAITEKQLVVTQETRFLHRVRPHIVASVPALVNVSWSLDPREATMELAFTGKRQRHRFLMNAHDRHQVWRLDAVFGQIFLQPLQLAF